jgi:predicted DNA-binding transcriptional regulator AlpA
MSESERSLTIKEFCKRHHISRGKYFDMRKAGIGPAEMRLGPSMVRISAEADLAWQHARENPTGSELVEIEHAKAALVARGSKAGSVAVQSPKHVSKTGRKCREVGVV